MSVRALTLALCGILVVATGTARADVKAGVDAWSAGDYDAAIAEWRTLADKGDADAQFNLAQAYRLGRGVPLDLARAKQLYGEAAAQGHIQAADNYGVLLFQDGAREQALPYIKASAARGDPRAQYILGVAHFNGDLVEKDWVRAYALVSLARQSDMPQATHALAQMDQFIPLAQRQESVVLAKELAAQANANRERLATTSELSGAQPMAGLSTQPGAPAPLPSPARVPTRIVETDPDALAPKTVGTTESSSPATAGADYARPAHATAPVPAPPPSAPRTAQAARPVPATAPAPRTPQAASPASGPWQLQLGAFGVASNANKLWQKLSSRPEVRGHGKRTETTGKLVKLFATGYPSKSVAASACSKLKADGFDCIVVHD